MITTVHHSLTRAPRLAAVSLLLASLLVFSGCSSPEQQAQKYYEEGMSLLKEGKADKAQIEFKNALQIKKNLTPAIYGMALVAEKNADIQGMYNLLNTVVEQDPNHIEAHLKLGSLLLAANQVDKAEEISNKALKIAPDNLSAQALRASLLLKKKDTEGAVVLAQQILQKDPNQIEALVLLATERLLAADATKAIEYLDRAIKQDEKNVALNLIKIEALNSIAKPELAEQVFRKLIAFYPGEKALRHELARFYLRHDRKDDAEKLMREGIEKSPKDLDAKMELIGFLRSVRGMDAARSQMEAFAKAEPENHAINFALVDLYRAANDIAAADALLRKMIQAAGNDADGLKAKGMLAALTIEKGDKAAGAKLLEEILAEDKRNELALLQRAALSIINTKYDNAIADLRTVLRDAPNSPQALGLLAKAHEMAGSPELADEHYMRAFQAGKYAAPQGMAYAEFLIKRRQPDRADKVLEEVLSAQPSNLAALKMQASIKMMLGDASGAQKIAEQIRKLGDKDNSADQITGTILASQKDYGESIAAFKRAYEAAPDRVQPMASLVRAYLMAGKRKEAIEFLNGEVKKNPQNTSAQVMLGQLQLLQGDKAQATSTLNSVIQMQPKSPVGYQQLSMLYLRTQDFDQARAVIDKGLAAVPNDPALRLNKAGLLEVTGRVDDAIQAYDNLLQDQPGSDIAANNLASLLTEHRNDKQSLERAYELSKRFGSSEIPQFRDTFGWASYKLGKLDEAKPALAKAAELQPNDPIYRYHLGLVYLAKKDNTSAKRELEKAIELAGKGNPAWLGDAQEKLKGL